MIGYVIWRCCEADIETVSLENQFPTIIAKSAKADDAKPKGPRYVQDSRLPKRMTRSSLIVMDKCGGTESAILRAGYDEVIAGGNQAERHVLIFWGEKGNGSMAKTANINIRIEPEVKAEAEKIFSELGITVSEAISIFLNKSIMEGGIPFEMKRSKRKK